MADKYGYEPITSAPVPTAEEIARRNIARSRQEAARKEEAEKRRLALIAEAKRQAAQKKRPAPDDNEDRPRSRPSTFSTVPDDIIEDDRPPKTVKLDDVEMPLDEAVSKIPEQMDFEDFVRASPLRERALARARTEELTAGGMAPEKAAEQARQEREKRQAAFERGREAVRKEPATADKEGRGFAESVTSGVGAPIARMLGFGQAANEAEARTAGVQAELSQFRDERYAHPQIAGAVAGAAQNTAQMGPGIAASMLGGPAVGMAVMSGQFGSQEYSRAAYEGAEAGLAGAELNRYALIQAGVEASIMPIMSKIPGMAGIEGRVLRQSVARGVAAHPTIRKALSGAGTLAKDTAAEVTEEVITEVLHGFASEGMLNEDVDYKAVIGDTVLQTLVMMGMTEGVTQAGRLMDSGRQVQPELTQPDQQTQQYETPVLKNPAIDAFIANPGSAKLYEAAVASGMAPLPNPNRTERRKYAAGLKQLSRDPAPQPALQNEASSAEMPPAVETPSGMVPDSEFDEFVNLYREGSSTNGQEANVTQTQSNRENERADEKGRQEREQGRQEGLLTVPQETAQETPSGTEGMTAAASPNDSAVSPASPEPAAEMGWKEKLYQENVDKAKKLTKEEFSKQYIDTYKRMISYKPDQAGSNILSDEMAAMSDAHPDWVEEIENTNQPTPPELASGELSPVQPAPSLAEPVSTQEATPVATGVPSPDQSSKEAGPVSETPPEPAISESDAVASLNRINKEVDRLGDKYDRLSKRRQRITKGLQNAQAKKDKTPSEQWGPIIEQQNKLFGQLNGTDADLKSTQDQIDGLKSESVKYADVLSAKALADEAEAENPGVQKQEPIQTVAGKMTYDEFEAKGYSPEQVTKQDWVNLQKSLRRSLGQPELSGTAAAPFADWEEFHRDAVAKAVKAGDEVDEEVLADYPDLKPASKTSRDRILAAVKQVNPRVQSGDMVSIADIRAAVGMEPAEFDQTMQQLVKDKVLAAHRFDRPGMVSDEQRQQMLKLGDAYHNTVSLWENEPGDRDRINQMMDDAESATKPAAPEAPTTAPGVPAAAPGVPEKPPSQVASGETMADKAKRLTALTAGTRGDGAVVNVPVTKRGKVETPVMDSIPAMTTNQRKRLQKQRAEQAPVEAIAEVTAPEPVPPEQKQQAVETPQPAIPEFKRTTPDKSSITRQDRADKISEVRTKIGEVEKRLNAKQKEYDGLRSNATKKRADAKREIGNLRDRRNDLEVSIRRDQEQLRLAVLEDAMESPRSYDHYLAGMAAINKIDDEYDDAKKRDARKFGDELFARAVNEGKSQGLNEFDADRAASSAVNGFTADDDRPLSYFVERAADRIREDRIAQPMGKLFPNQNVYRGETTKLSDAQRDQFAEQLREASKDDQNATSKISAINKQIDKAIQDIKDKAEADAKKKADAAAKEKAIQEQEELKNAREKSKRYFQAQRINKALKATTVKTKPVFVRQETAGGPVKIVEGERTEDDKKGELYPNGLILHPEFAENSTDWALTSKQLGLAFPLIANKSNMKALVGLIDTLGIDFNNVEVNAEGNLPSDLRSRMQKINSAWENDDYSKLDEQDRSIVEKLAEVAPTDIQADLILTADDLGANGIPPGMGSIMTERGVKVVKDMAKDVPEFAYDPVFTFQSGKLVFRDGYTFRFSPQVFNLHPSELKEGQTVGINLEDLGINRATPQDVVAAMLKNAGLPKVLKSKSGRDVTAGYIGSTPASVQQGKEDNEWDVVSGTREVRKIVFDTLSKIRWRQPGQSGDPSTEINGDTAVAPESEVTKDTQPAETQTEAPEPAATEAPEESDLRKAANKAQAEVEAQKAENAKQNAIIVSELQRGMPLGSLMPISDELAQALAKRTIGAIRLGIKQFEAFIKTLRADLDENVVQSLKPTLIRVWNTARDKYGLDEATDSGFDAAMSNTVDVDVEQLAEAAKGETPEEMPAEPATDQQPTSKMPATDPDDEPTIGIKKAKRAERLQELGLEQEDIVSKIGHSFPELDADAKMVSPGEAEDVFTRIGEGAEAADNASDRDVFVMLNHYAKKQMETRQTQDELETARKAGDDFKVAELEAKLSVQVAEEVRLMAIAKSAGTASGRALAAFKALLKYDFSLARLRLRLDAAADGKPTEAQTREQMELHAKYEAALKELEAKTKEAEEATARAEIAEQIARDMEAKSSKGKTKADRRLEAAWKPFQKADTFFSVTGAFQMLPEFIELAGAHIEKGVETFSEFIDKLSKHFGRQPKPETVPVLQQAWDVAWDNEKNPKPLGPPKVSIEPDHPGSLVGAAKALFRFFLSQGITDTDAVIDAVHEELQNQFPGEIGERLDTMKAMVDYDKTRTLSQDPLDILAADKRAIVQLKAKIEDMKRGIAPRRFEQRYPVSDEQRAHIKMFNEEKRKGGFVVTDPDRQAKTALASLETRLRHSISDTLNEIASGARTVSEKTAAPTSDTIEDLQAYLALVRGMHKSIFGDRTMTQEQRLKAAEAAAVKNEAYWNDRLSRAKAGDFSTGKTKPTPVTNAAIDAIKARSELAKAQVQELKELANPKPDPEAISDARYLTSLEKQLAVKLARIADIMARAAAGDFAPERNMSKEKREANAQRRKSDANIRDARIKLDEATKALNEQIEQVKKKNLTYVDLALRVPGAAWSTLRDLKLTGELSFILRQGGPRVFGVMVPAGKIARAGLEALSGNPDAAKAKLKQAGQGYKQLGATLGRTLKAAFGKTDTELARSMDALRQRPNYKNGTYEAMRLSLHEDGSKFSVAEELFINNLVELGGLALDKRFPGFKGFRDGHPVFAKTAHNLNLVNRLSNATKVFMNEMRADMADDAAALWTMKSGEMTPAEARSLGNVVNAFTGKGDMSLIGMEGKKAQNFLSKLLISAPWLMSRLQLLSGQPLWSKGRTPETQKAAAEMYVDMAAGVAAYYGAFILAGMFMADDDDERPVVEWDSTSSDFMKVRIGKTRMDPLFGLQQVIVLMSRILHDEIKDSRGVVRKRKGFEDDWALISRFQEGRLHPGFQDIRSFRTGKDFMGQPITKTEAAIGMVLPITYPAIVEASKRHGIPASIAMGIWAMAGGGLATYDARTKARADLAAELSIVQRKLKNPNTPAAVRKSLQVDADTMIESHLVNAVRSEATNNGNIALVDQAASYKPGTTMSPELTEAIQKEKGDLVLRAAERLSTELQGKDKKSPDEDKSITTARDLLKAVAPTYEEANRLYTEAYKRENGSVAELVGPEGKKRYAPKKNVIAARRRLKAMYEIK